MHRHITSVTWQCAAINVYYLRLIISHIPRRVSQLRYTEQTVRYTQTIIDKYYYVTRYRTVPHDLLGVKFVMEQNAYCARCGVCRKRGLTLPNLQLMYVYLPDKFGMNVPQCLAVNNIEDCVCDDCIPELETYYMRWNIRHGLYYSHEAGIEVRRYTPH